MGFEKQLPELIEKAPDDKPEESIEVLKIGDTLHKLELRKKEVMKKAAEAEGAFKDYLEVVAQIHKPSPKGGRTFYE